MRTLLICLSCCVFFLCPLAVQAHPVISEVMWMGTDLSTADEWLELMNPDQEDIDISGWTVTSLNSSAKEIIAVRFATGTLISPGEFLVIASKSAANSRLLAEPFAVSTSLTLPNTKLLVRLRDAAGSIVDEVDDGIGVPFSGSNPSGTGAKASMERVDAAAPGNLKENWQIATLSVGFDEAANVFGTPGSDGTTEVAEPPAPPPADPPPPVPPPPPPPHSEPTACVDPLEIAIAVQSGPLLAIGKATVNFQAVATVGTLTGVPCSWSYGDGFVSTSCNPPVHSFTNPGTYTVRLEAKNQCGNTLVQEQIVEVKPDPASSQNSLAQTEWYDGSRLIIIGALPNPDGTDTGKEWIDIKNTEERAVDLRGWKLAVGELSIQSYLLKDSIGPGDTLRIYDNELKFRLPNTASRLQLITPSGLALSTVPWKQADEGRVYYPDDIRSLTVRGRVLRVTGPVTFMIQLEPDAARVLGFDTVNVRIIGIRENPDAVITENIGAYEFLRALIENKNIELQFDTETWDELGRLAAHIEIEGGISAATQMIISKLWIADPEFQHRKKQEFLDLQKSVAPGGFGGFTSTVSLKQQPFQLRISEVYPSPFPLPNSTNTGDWKNEEWIEIQSMEHHAVDLSGFQITTRKSKKSLPEGLKIVSDSRIILRTASFGLGLRNAGDVVSLVSLEGDVIESLEYPATKNGMSYAVLESGACLTIQPTPGEKNVCIEPAKKVTKASAAAKKSVAPKKASAKVRSYAASYRAQMDSYAEEKDQIVLGRNTEKEPFVLFLFMFLLGSSLTAALVVVFPTLREHVLRIRKGE